MRHLLLLPAVLLATAVLAADWHHPLYLGNGDVWRQRLVVTVRNAGDQPVAGETISFVIGTGAGEANLVGAQAQSVRVCNAAGTEMLYALGDAAGKRLKSGTIAAGGALAIPVECEAKAEATYYVYFDNPHAWGVPDFWRGAGQLRNPGMEEGTGTEPDAWNHDAGDDQHRASWVTENPHSGKRCLKTVVAEGAPNTWIATRQRDLTIQGGARYVMTAWVKADNVKGNAGWYIHVGNAENSMIISPMLNGGGGTYDWKQVRAEFTAPPTANNADLGTVLWGTGTAWFDDVELTCLDAGQARLTATVSGPEKLQLTETGASAPWLKGSAYLCRVPVVVTNLSNDARRGLVSVSTVGLTARLNGRADCDKLVVAQGTKRVKSYRLQDTLLFEGDAPAHTRATYYLYFPPLTTGRKVATAAPARYAPNPAIPEAYRETQAIGGGADYAALLASPSNLAKNPSFEQGDKLPIDWPGTAEGDMPAGASLGLVEGGLFGKRCARMVIPADAKKAWTGWRQQAPVQPGHSYLFASWLKCQDLAGGLQLHVHLLTPEGKLVKENAFSGAGPALNGTVDWKLLSGVFTTPADCGRFEMHLTMLATGTAWHDGVLLTEVMSGEVGGLQQPTGGTQASLSLWPVNAVVKVFRDDLPPAKLPEARISVARNEYEPLQVAVRNRQAMQGVTLKVQAPTNARGQSLRDLSLGVVGYVPIDHATSYYSSKTPLWYRKFPTSAGSCDGFPGMWPDPLLPHDRFDLVANETQPVWVTVRVPEGAAAGDYKGTVLLEQGGKAVAKLPFTVHVWDFALPAQSHVKAIYDCRQGGDIWAVPGMDVQQRRQAFWKFMADHRVCPDQVQPGPSLRYENGQVIADFAAFDQAAEYYFDVLKLPHSYTPWNFYCFGWGHPPGEKFGQKPYEGAYPYADVDRSKLRPEFKQAYQACLKVYWDHLKAKGWADKVTLYISDEPYDSKPTIIAQMQALCDMIHEVEPNIPIYCSTWHHQPKWDGYLTVWGLGHYGIVPVEKIQELEQSGATVWWTTDGQMCTDTPYCAVERLLPHYCFKYGAKAYEFWGIDWLTYNPYEFGWHAYINQSGEPGESSWVRYPNGDGFLAYPGKPIGYAGPVSSIRLEQAREGVEDYEYLYLLRERIARAKAAGKNVSAAEQALARAEDLVTIPNAGGRYSTRILPDPQAVFAVKEAVAKAVEGLK